MCLKKKKKRRKKENDEDLIPDINWHLEGHLNVSRLCVRARVCSQPQADQPERRSI